MASDKVVVYTADIQRLAEDFAAISGGSFQDAVYKILEDATFQIQMLAQNYAPVDTGELRDTITSEIETRGTKVTGYVIANAPYALYQEFGTGSRGEFPGRPYTIKPRPPNKFLKFQTKSGKTVYAKEVTHPGIPPRPFMRPAAERYFGPILDNIENAAIISIIQTPTPGAAYQVQGMRPSFRQEIDDIQAQGAPQ